MCDTLDKLSLERKTEESSGKWASTYCALLISNGLHPAGALLVGVLIATVFGAINGGIVANTKIPPFIEDLPYPDQHSIFSGWYR